MTQPITANKALTPGSIGDLQLRNRFIRAGCFEGMSQGEACYPGPDRASPARGGRWRCHDHCCVLLRQL